MKIKLMRLGSYILKKKNKKKKELNELETKQNQELEKLEVALIRKNTFFLGGGRGR